MKAARVYRYGRPDVVVVEDVARPEPTEDRVLVRVKAASVNRADLDGLAPKPSFIRLFMGLRAPRNPKMGIDVAGVVEAVGPDATRFQPGDEVFADLFPAGGGAFAEYAMARERLFQPKPPAMSFEDAAAMPHSAVLAVQGLRLRRGRTVQPGETVLIDGASGNVGPFAVQIAKAMGATVTGVASGPKLDFVRSLGADDVIDYRTTDYTRLGRRWDWIVAVDSHLPIRRVHRALAPGGVYLTMGGTTTSIVGSMLIGPLIGKLTGRTIGLMLHWKPFHAPDVATLVDLYAAGAVRPVIDRRYGLDEIVEALRRVDDGRASGKVIVTP